MYDLDAIELRGEDDQPPAPPPQAAAGDGWGRVWQEETGLLLIVHSERGSRQSNALEADVIERILAARDGGHPPDSVAVITPHRAQRAMLRARLEPYADAVTIIDTVERLQGGERPTIIVSGTESDPQAIGAAASFILNLNRANVAFSRTQERLIVVCAETLLDYVPAELEDYESAMLWKSLRNGAAGTARHRAISEASSGRPRSSRVRRSGIRRGPTNLRVTGVRVFAKVRQGPRALTPDRPPTA